MRCAKCEAAEARVKELEKEPKDATGIMSRLSEIKARLQAATRGPWKASETKGGELRVGNTRGDLVCVIDGGSEFSEAVADAALISAAPSDIAWLVEQVEQMREALNGVRERMNATKVIHETVTSLSRLTDFEVGLIQEAHAMADAALARLDGGK